MPEPLGSFPADDAGGLAVPESALEQVGAGVVGHRPVFLMHLLRG